VLDVYFQMCIIKPYEVGHPLFYCSAGITKLLRSIVIAIALNNFIRYSYYEVVQPFQINSLLIKELHHSQDHNQGGGKTEQFPSEFLEKHLF